MDIWTETMVSRVHETSQFALTSFLTNKFWKKMKFLTLSLHGVSCGGQLQNFIMTCFFLWVLNENENVKSIIHHLPITGPSFLPNDRDFGDVEKSKSKKDATYTVSQYEQLIKSSKKKSSNVKLMGTQDFLDFMKGINFSNLHKPVDSEEEKSSWL